MSHCQICNASVDHSREVLDTSTNKFVCICLECRDEISDTLSEFEPEETNLDQDHEV